MKAAIAVVCAGVILAASCDRKPATPVTAPPAKAPVKPPVNAPVQPVSPPATAAVPSSAPKAEAPTGQAGQGTVAAMGLTFKVPDGWKSVPPGNSMRLAEMQVPDASGDAAKGCTVVFATAGGDVKANIDRWVGQVKDASGQPPTPVLKTRAGAGLTVHIVELTGSYSPGMGDSKVYENWMLRGAITQTAQGMLFVKMTGPAEQMKAAGPAFEAMIDGMT